MHNELIDRIIGAPMHVLVSLRAKTEWVLERDEKTGKTAPRKVGLAPVMRDGIEYEFDVCGEMDQENTLIITKSRCPKLTGGVFVKPGKEVADVLKEWLDGPPAPQPAQAPAVAPKPDGDAPSNGKLNGINGSGGENGSGVVHKSVPPELEAIWKRMCSPRGVIAEFARLRESLSEAAGTDGESEFQEVLRGHGVERPSDFKSSQPARLCAKELFLAIERHNENREACVAVAAGPAAAATTPQE
jgi:hypothetical protein